MSGGVVVLHFWSPTCGPCKVIKPSIEMMKEEFDEDEKFKGQIQWVSINTKEDPRQLSRQFQVAVVPTIVVLKNNQEVGRHSGTNISIYYTLIRKALST